MITDLAVFRVKCGFCASVSLSAAQHHSSLTAHAFGLKSDILPDDQSACLDLREGFTSTGSLLLVLLNTPAFFVCFAFLVVLFNGSIYLLWLLPSSFQSPVLLSCQPSCILDICSYIFIVCNRSSVTRLFGL